MDARGNNGKKSKVWISLKGPQGGRGQTLIKKKDEGDEGKGKLRKKRKDERFDGREGKVCV